MLRSLLRDAVTGILVLCAVVVTGLVARRELAAPAAPPPAPAAEVADWARYADEGNRMGPASGSAVILEFSDFQCPYCRAMADRLAQARSRHPGRLTVVYRHFPIASHPFAEDAARGSECAAAQGRFEPMHDALFASQADLGRTPLGGLAARAGVPDTAAFGRCLDGGWAKTRVARDRNAAQELHLRVTPTLLIGGHVIEGVPPADTLEYYIRRELGGPAPGSPAPHPGTDS